MPTVSKVNDILCVNISKIDNISKANAKKLDNIDFCSPTPTQTPTQTPGGSANPTPTPTVTPTVTPTYTPTSTVTPTVTPTYTPTYTPTGTPTPTPTPTETVPCRRGCCYVELCIGGDCTDACQCNNVRGVYLSVPCDGDPCLLSTASGIYDDDTCSTQAATAYYSDGVDCYYWDGSSISYQGPC
jgi:hypothetical protein